MNAVIKHTSGELAVLDLLKDAGEQGQQAYNRISEAGFPTRRVEAWHFTDLRNLLTDYPAAGSSDELGAKKAYGACKPLLPSVELPIVNGHYHPELAGTLPQKVLVASHGGTAERAEIFGDETINLINRGLVRDGLTIVVHDDARIEEPLSLTHIMADETSSAAHHSIKVGKGASVTLMERYLTVDPVAALSNVVCDLEVADNGQAVWVIDQQMSDQAKRFGQLNVKLGVNASLTILSLNSGGRFVRQEVNVQVAGEGSELNIHGVNLVGKATHIDVTTRLNHLVPDTNASETFRNVVVGNGHGVFQGQINVAAIAQKTDARMACNSLLLDDESEFSAKPELEIFADDVQCAHGATVADIDDSHLFYLMARGIPEKIARAMLVKAFVAEVFEDIEAEEIGHALNERIDIWLNLNG